MWQILWLEILTWSAWKGKTHFQLTRWEHTAVLKFVRVHFGVTYFMGKHSFIHLLELDLTCFCTSCWSAPLRCIIKVFVNNELLLPFHVFQVTLISTDRPSGVSRSVSEPQLDSQEGNVMLFYLCTFSWMNLDLIWIKTVTSAFQDTDFDVSL